MYSLALTGQAPKVFKTCSKSGVPYIAVIATALLSCLTYLSVKSGSAVVFAWFLNLCTISGFLAWIVLFMAHLVRYPPHSHRSPRPALRKRIVRLIECLVQRFRQALAAQNLLSTLPYTSPGQPYTTYIAMSVLILLTLTNGFQVFFPGNFSATSFFAAYATLPLFLAMYLGHKFWCKTPLVRPLEEVDLWTGMVEADRAEERSKETKARNWMQRVWRCVC